MNFNTNNIKKLHVNPYTEKRHAQEKLNKLEKCQNKGEIKPIQQNSINLFDIAEKMKYEAMSKPVGILDNTQVIKPETFFLNSSKQEIKKIEKKKVLSQPHTYISRRYSSTREDKKAFVEQSFSDWYYTLRQKGHSYQDAIRIAGFLALQDAKESFYGNNLDAFINHYNGGMNNVQEAKKRGRKFYPIYYPTVIDYYNAKYNDIVNKWPKVFEAQTIGEFYDAENKYAKTGCQYSPIDDNQTYLEDLNNMSSAWNWINACQQHYQTFYKFE